MITIGKLSRCGQILVFRFRLLTVYAVIRMPAYIARSFKLGWQLYLNWKCYIWT